MMLYEVNLKISTTILDSYLKWLIPHIRQILQLKGFQNARYLSDLSSEEGFKKLTIQYEVDTLENLQHYLGYHADRLREEGIQQFSDQFSATRRIFEIQQIFYQEDGIVKLVDYDSSWPNKALAEMTEKALKGNYEN